MGIFTSTGFSDTSVDIYSPAEQELCCEGFDINFYEASMVAVAESEAIYNRSMKEVGIAELRYFEENGQEVIYEAVDVKAIFEKIKMFFKKLIDKVKAIFHTFIAKISSFVSGNKDFVRKYEKEFARKWNDVKEDFEFKGYKFTIKNEISDVVDESAISVEENVDKCPKFDDIKDETDLTELNKTKQATIDYREEINDATRAVIYNFIKNIASDGNTSAKDETSLDSKEYSEELFKLFRNGETSKEMIEKKDIVGGVATITTELRTADKTKRAAEKLTRLTTKAIDRSVKAIERFQKELLRGMPDKTGNTVAEKNENTNVKSAILGITSEICSIMKNSREYFVQGSGAYLQALKDRSAQYKAIMVKVISGSKKMQRESYNYTNESYDGSGSFLDRVVLK